MKVKLSSALALVFMVSANAWADGGTDGPSNNGSPTPPQAVKAVPMNEKILQAEAVMSTATNGSFLGGGQLGYRFRDTRATTEQGAPQMSDGQAAAGFAGKRFIGKVVIDGTGATKRGTYGLGVKARAEALPHTMVGGLAIGLSHRHADGHGLTTIGYNVPVFGGAYFERDGSKVLGLKHGLNATLERQIGPAFVELNLEGGQLFAAKALGENDAKLEGLSLYGMASAALEIPLGESAFVSARAIAQGQRSKVQLEDGSKDTSALSGGGMISVSAVF